MVETCPERERRCEHGHRQRPGKHGGDYRYSRSSSARLESQPRPNDCLSREGGLGKLGPRAPTIRGPSAVGGTPRPFVEEQERHKCPACDGNPNGQRAGDKDRQVDRKAGVDVCLSSKPYGHKRRCHHCDNEGQHRTGCAYEARPEEDNVRYLSSRSPQGAEGRVVLGLQQRLTSDPLSDESERHHGREATEKQKCDHIEMNAVLRTRGGLLKTIDVPRASEDLVPPDRCRRGGKRRKVPRAMAQADPHEVDARELLNRQADPRR